MFPIFRDQRFVCLVRNVDRMMAITCPMEYEMVHTRMRSASPSDLVDWLANRTPEMTSALSDASKADPQALTGSMDSLQSNNLFGAVRQTSLPCLFVYGQNDPAIQQPSTEKQTSLSSMMHQVTLEGSGHFPMLDETQKFNRLLIDFLALDSGISPQELSLKEEWKRRVR